MMTTTMATNEITFDRMIFTSRSTMTIFAKTPAWYSGATRSTRVLAVTPENHLRMSATGQSRGVFFVRRLRNKLSRITASRMTAPVANEFQLIGTLK